MPRFAAVQLAFDSPRCRVLIFHTGRLVGTGCSGPMAARLAIMRAARQLAVEAGVHIHVRNFSVINQVGAASIDARLDCDAFASTHSATSHYDRASFVVRSRTLVRLRSGATERACARLRAGPGLAAREREHLLRDLRDGARQPGPPPHPQHRHRPLRPDAARARQPGSTRERDMLTSFSRMLPELLRHSDRKDVFERLPAHLKAAHRPRDVQRDDAPAAAHAHAHAPTRSAKKRAAPSLGLHELWGADGLGEASGADGDLSSLIRDCGEGSDDEALLASAGF